MTLNPKPSDISSFHFSTTAAADAAIPAHSQHQRKLLAAMDRNMNKAPVVYYLSRNGQLEHPHFVEVPLSDDSGRLCLRDVLQRLNQIRGRNMANSYSWSSKRSYKNGYVWQDLSEDDFIHPCHGHEYILKGSELILFDASSSFRHHKDTNTTTTTTTTTGLSVSSDDQFNVLKPTQARSWSKSGAYMVYKLPNGSNRSTTGGGITAASDMATQTGEDRKIIKRLVNESIVDNAIELKREEVSPPSSSSSNETLEKGIVGSCEERGVGMSGRLRVSEALMQLIACGSKSVKDGASVGSEGDNIGARDQGRRLSVDAQD